MHNRVPFAPKVLLAVLTAVVSLGCQTAPPPASYPDIASDAVDAERLDPAALRNAFVAAPDFGKRMQRLLELEAQALQIIEDEPLKLGTIGAAILDIYYGSQTGHFAMTHFYRHVESAEAVTPHERWLAALQQNMATERDGTLTAPFRVMTPFDAQTYALTNQQSPVGSVYQSTEEHPFVLLQKSRQKSRPEDQPILDAYFDLASMYDSIRQDLDVPEAGVELTPFALMGYLAKNNDTAAQTAIGAFFASRKQAKDAVGWLNIASRKGNLLANTLLASIYWEQASQAQSEEGRASALEHVLENYLHAVALGSDEAMYALAVLYLNDQFGEENAASGVSLLNQAAGLGHTDAMLYLGHLYAGGIQVEKDLDRAVERFVSAAERQNHRAQLSYARFMLNTEGAPPADSRTHEWLRELAEEGRADAMVMLGNLHARGVGTDASIRDAIRWFKRAVRNAPEDADIVNEVAWTLTVSDINGLQRAAYARRIMDRQMTANEDARARPEYLDTWAATHAANGDFARAVDLQQQALTKATETDRDDVIDILQEHLTLFRASTPINEKAP